jgi:hypothetical protein
MQRGWAPPQRSVWRVVREAWLERKLDSILAGERAARAATTVQPAKPKVVSSVTLQVQLWDGDIPMMPLIVLEYVPKRLRIYERQPQKPPPPPGASPRPGPRDTADDDGPAAAQLDSARSAAGAGPAVAQLDSARSGVGSELWRAPSGTAERRMASIADPHTLEATSLAREVRAHESYGDILRRAQLRRSALGDVAALGARWELRTESPHFFYLGKRIRRADITHDDARTCSPRPAPLVYVKDMMRVSPQFGVGWSEATVDVALNRAADLHLSSRQYDASYTFSAYVHGVELARPATEEAPFGLAPSTYVSVQHGSSVRYSHIERETRSPTFEWLTGSIPYEPDEPLKLRVFIARRQVINPRTDILCGQMWLEAPVLPLPRALSYPELLPLSLGTNVGVVHLSLRGPAVRRKVNSGCACWCGPECMIPIAGSPPRVPACSVVAARTLSCVWSCATSEQCLAVTAAACCCCLAVVGIKLMGSADSAQQVFDVTSGLRSAQTAVSAQAESELVQL